MSSSNGVRLQTAFTTEPHGYIRRGNKTVRKRCIEFIESLKIQGIRQLTVEHAKDTFTNIVDHWDQITLNKYFGVQPHITRQESETRSRYSNDNMIIKRSERTLHIPLRKGYLEKLGFVHYEKRGKIWFMVLSESGPIVPELVKTPEQVGKSNDNFYFSPIGSQTEEKKDSMARSFEDLHGPSVVGEKRERELCERNKDRSSESDSGIQDCMRRPIDYFLGPEEKRILEAAVPRKDGQRHNTNSEVT